MKKRLYSIFIAILLVVAIPINTLAAMADYVSLGDSIAYGSGLSTETPPAKNYFSQVSTYLQSTKGFSSINLATEGKTSTTLIADLTQNKIGNAKVITISIGGNNLIGPIFQAIYNAYGIDPTLSGEQKMAALISAIQTDPSRWNVVVANLMDSAKPGGALYTELQKGINQFLNDWPLVMKEVSRLAPKARIYVLTMYNPVLKDKNLGLLFSSLLLPVNSAIRLTPIKYRNVVVVDSSILFALQPAALSFNLSANPITQESIDPHPTKIGHKIIADKIILIEKLKKLK